MNMNIVIAMITIIPFFAFKLMASLLPNPNPMMLGLGGTENIGEATKSKRKRISESMISSIPRTKKIMLQIGN